MQYLIPRIKYKNTQMVIRADIHADIFGSQSFYDPFSINIMGAARLSTNGYEYFYREMKEESVRLKYDTEPTEGPDIEGHYLALGPDATWPHKSRYH